MTEKEFFNKLKEKYGDKYEYKVINENVDIQPYNTIAITCQKHGLFFSTPFDLLNNEALCPKCMEERLN